MAWGIEHPKTIDLIAVDPNTNIARLIIVGPTPWNGSEREQKLLAKKIESYISYVESGELYDSYPELAQHHIRFQIDNNSPLPISTRTFHERVENVLRPLGISMELYDL